MDARRSAVSFARAVFLLILRCFFALTCVRMSLPWVGCDTSQFSPFRTILLEMLPSRMDACAKRLATRNDGKRHDLFHMSCEDNPWRSDAKFRARLAYIASAAIVLGTAPAASAQHAGILPGSDGDVHDPRARHQFLEAAVVLLMPINAVSIATAGLRALPRAAHKPDQLSDREPKLRPRAKASTASQSFLAPLPRWLL
jgi:hypothetical protein